MLAAMKADNFAQRAFLQLTGGELVALEKTPVLANGPAQALDFGAVPLDELNSVLDVLCDGLLREDMLSRQQGLANVRRLIGDGQPALPLVFEARQPALGYSRDNNGVNIASLQESVESGIPFIGVKLRRSCYDVCDGLCRLQGPREDRLEGEVLGGLDGGLYVFVSRSCGKLRPLAEEMSGFRTACSSRAQMPESKRSAKHGQSEQEMAIAPLWGVSNAGEVRVGTRLTSTDKTDSDRHGVMRIFLLGYEI